MCNLTHLLFLITLFSNKFSSVVSKSQICEFADTPCLTRAGSNIYKAVAHGVPNVVDPIDPLYLETASGDFTTFHYEVRNITLTGLRNCEVQLLKYHESTYQYNILCPHLEFNYYYEATGSLDGVELNGIGLGLDIFEDYLIIIKGRSEKYISEKDQKSRLFLKDFHVETELKGKYKFQTTKIIKGDKTKFDFVAAYLNDNSKAVEKDIQSQNFLEKFWELIVVEINKYLKEYPLEELFAKDQK